MFKIKLIFGLKCRKIYSKLRKTKKMRSNEITIEEYYEDIFLFQWQPLSYSFRKHFDILFLFDTWSHNS